MPRALDEILAECGRQWRVFDSIQRRALRFDVNLLALTLSKPESLRFVSMILVYAFNRCGACPGQQVPLGCMSIHPFDRTKKRVAGSRDTCRA